jgi:hypothetical protein
MERDNYLKNDQSMRYKYNSITKNSNNIPEIDIKASGGKSEPFCINLTTDETVYEQNKCIKTLSLLQVLCKTYKKDMIFAHSMLNLLERLEDEVNSLFKQNTRLETKKRHYKKMARNYKAMFKSAVADERRENETRLKEHQQIISE